MLFFLSSHLGAAKTTLSTYTFISCGGTNLGTLTFFLHSVGVKADLGFILPYKGYKTYLHDGGDIGYRSMLALIPEKKLGIVLLSNIDIEAVYFKILDILLAEKSQY